MNTKGLVSVTIALSLSMAYSTTTFAAAPHKIHVDDSKDIREFQVDPSVYRVGDREYSLYYITKAGVVVVDPCNDKIAKATMDSIRKHTQLPVKFVIYSHNHWDHVKGGQIFKDQGAVFISHALAAQHLQPDPDVVPPDYVWNGKDQQLKIGDKTISMHYFGYKTHGDGNILIKIDETGGIYNADLFVPDRVLFQYVADGYPRAFLKAQKEMLGMDFKKLYPAHVRVEANRQDLENQVHFLEDLYAAIDKAKAQGVSQFELPYKVKLPQWDWLLMYNEWLPLNIMKAVTDDVFGLK